MSAVIQLEGAAIPVGKPGRKPREKPELAEAPMPDMPDLVSGEEVTGDLPPAQELSTSPKKRRGRPPKSEQNLDGLKQMLFATHMILSRIASCPELAIDDAESLMLAGSLAKLADHYKIKLDGKGGALVGFLYTCGMIYGPRGVAIAIRVRNNRTNVDGGPNQAS